MPNNGLKNDRWTIRWLKAMAEVDQRQWDRLAAPLQTPILEWQWLHQMEASGSIGPRHGWHPLPPDPVGRETADCSRAPVYENPQRGGIRIRTTGGLSLPRATGIAYYPKMVGMSPATPAVGYAFLMDDGLDRSIAMPMMCSAIDHYCKEKGITGCHFNFVAPDWIDAFTRNRLCGLAPSKLLVAQSRFP